MNLKIARSLLTLMIGMVLATGAIYAQDDDNSIMERLNLSSQQKEQIKKLRDGFRSNTEGLRKDLKELKDQIRALKKENPVPEKELESLLKKQANVEIQLSLAITRFQSDLEAILTVDQKRLLKRIQQEK